MKIPILIVGAGPAGSIAAIEARKYGVDVLLVDKKKEIGKPVQCAEFIPALLLTKIKIPNSCVAFRVKGIKTYIYDECFYTNAPGYILHRDKFDQYLADGAVKAGALLWKNTLCQWKNGILILKKEGKEIRIEPQIIIGADGPKSTIGRWFGIINKDFIPAIQYRMELINPLDVAEIYFWKECISGYGWLFPKGMEANVGVGARVDNLKKLLDAFVYMLRNKVKGPPISTTYGIIPVGGPLTAKDNVILIGDAGGMTHPITGAGIVNAIITGKIAGRVAAKTIKGEDSLASYTNEWQKLLGNELNRARMKRKFMDANWDNFHLTIKKCWVTFNEYYGRNSVSR